jgi:hypothetical protein
MTFNKCLISFKDILIVLTLSIMLDSFLDSKVTINKQMLSSKELFIFMNRAVCMKSVYCWNKTIPKISLFITGTHQLSLCLCLNSLTYLERKDVTEVPCNTTNYFLNWTLATQLHAYYVSTIMPALRNSMNTSFSS